MSAAQNTEMPKAYEPQRYEKDIYEMWEQSGAFRPNPNGDKDPYVIAIPPPNITGQLHAGHAMFLTIEDIMIRYKRMQGHQALWIPGTDHAAIATETVVLKKNGITDRNKELTRDEFMQKAEKFVEETGGIIRRQIRRMGASCDWKREAYTFDAPRNHAVNTIFKQLYDKGLIYRGNRLINWSTGAQSVLADDELEWEDKREPFYSIRCGEFVIGTVRSETKCADSPVVIHPDAQYVRFQINDGERLTVVKNLWDDKERLHKTLNMVDLEGANIIETIAGADLVGNQFTAETYAGERTFYVIADAKVIDPDKGTGIMTISSCHSADDYELAKRRKLDQTWIQKIDFEGNMTDIAGSCAGMFVAKARNVSGKLMAEKGLLVGKDDHYQHRVPICYRSGVIVEPMISKQWFIDVEKEFVDDYTGEVTSLKKMTYDAVLAQDAEVTIVPERFNKIYRHWIENLRDWCISRQIWWGHRIPVWYDAEGKIAAVGSCEDETGLAQDEDTLDTWFSSALWPFSTLGWPNQDNADFKDFYPTDVLETGHDILFFWVARMIMFGKFATGQYPFRTVYLHGLVQDEKGQKMSKSKGNGIDPIEIIDEFGTDALRLSLIMGTTPGNNSNIGKQKIAGCRNFCNKLWNISRYILSTQGEGGVESMTDLQIWLNHKITNLTAETNQALEQYQFGVAAEKLWHFTWEEFADIALEAAKAENNPQTFAQLKQVLTTLLQLWHPFIPFVTEAIWKYVDTESHLIIQPYPESTEIRNQKSEIRNFEEVNAVAAKIRSMRKLAGVDPTKKITAHVTSENAQALQVLQNDKTIIESLARLETLSFEVNNDTDGATDREAGFDIFLPNHGMIDAAAEQERLKKELQNAEKYLLSLEDKLSNPGFTDKAPTALVDKTKAQAEETREKIMVMKSKLS